MCHDTHIIAGLLDHQEARIGDVGEVTYREHLHEACYGLVHPSAPGPASFPWSCLLPLVLPPAPGPASCPWSCLLPLVLLSVPYLETLLPYLDPLL